MMSVSGPHARLHDVRSVRHLLGAARSTQCRRSTPWRARRTNTSHSLSTAILVLLRWAGPLTRSTTRGHALPWMASRDVSYALVLLLASRPKPEGPNSWMGDLLLISTPHRGPPTPPAEMSLRVQMPPTWAPPIPVACARPTTASPAAARKAQTSRTGAMPARVNGGCSGAHCARPAPVRTRRGLCTSTVVIGATFATKQHGHRTLAADPRTMDGNNPCTHQRVPEASVRDTASHPPRGAAPRPRRCGGAAASAARLTGVRAQEGRQGHLAEQRSRAEEAVTVVGSPVRRAP